ncbi:hypothetical protein [Nocardioides sp. Root140]|uniref:hypothetical protein n=1 Tax=Nocardioides sp. Root140 TaxID=1736460 RepID=UPI0006F3593E|nr:hypothetical protein [Nocardioides sp. Root140]KQY61822.1 hypothetical protein ASD30_25100 [Nocardioides sp. Root140]
MPNWVTNQIEAKAEVLALLLNEAGEVDFAQIVPPPLDLETGGCRGSGTFEEVDGELAWVSTLDEELRHENG